jgi:hypothetical protein
MRRVINSVLRRSFAVSSENPPRSRSKYPGPRSDADFASPEESRQSLLEAKNYQAQLLYTIGVALVVAGAAFYQASASSGRSWSAAAERQKIQMIQEGRLSVDEATVNPIDLSAEEAEPIEGQIVWVSSGNRRQPANLAPTGAVRPLSKRNSAPR